ncbi:uncharacterized protein LOC133192601 isoform X2 [Saccostrea echinata]|uniref:uncharacterized protein LOC133192601 isoform X2 n=1 Tax=Saccostrea echinata TaxID=191078 RepID=UPI002A82CA76|nr:uncharacterized protein LOC133192601 isoform X2 [Saccostrea echinata]
MAYSEKEKESVLPSRVSSWTNSTHLDMLRVFYAPNGFADPSDIFENIVDDENSLRTDPEVTKKYIVEVEECMKKLSSLDIFEYMRTKGIQEHELELRRLLTKVYAKSHDFLEMVIKFMKMMLLPTRPFKSAYTELIRVFSNMCDLTSVPGDTFRRLITLKDEAVVCLPDIRYFLEAPTSVSDPKDLLVLKIAELKREKKWVNREDKDFNIVMEVDDKVLGQHGGELIVESPFSFFKPYVLGALCLKTEIIFTVLEMDIQHFDKLVSNEYLTSEKAYIYYTKPYNMMIAEERGMLLDLLLRLSLFQRNIH